MPADGLSVAEQARREARLFRQQFGEEVSGHGHIPVVLLHVIECSCEWNGVLGMR